MTAAVEILIYQADNVLSVPDQAILEFDGKYHVAVKKSGGGFDWREVTVGQANEKYVEVKQGLQSGDVVILEPLSLMSEAEKREKLTKPPTPAERAKRKAARKSLSPSGLPR